MRVKTKRKIVKVPISRLAVRNAVTTIPRGVLTVGVAYTCNPGTTPSLRVI